MKKCGFTTSNHKTRTKRGFIALCGGAVLVVLALIVAGVLLFQSLNTAPSKVAAQESALPATNSSAKKQPTQASFEMINLVSLVGKTKEEALLHIGHGAVLLEESSAAGFANKATIVLSDVKGDDLAGTPTVVLTLDEGGLASEVSYTFPISLFGYGDIAFAPAVNEFHLIEKVLSAAGLEGVEEGSIVLPEKEAYSIYESDRKTLSMQRFTFTGTAQSQGVSYLWEAVLTYDFAEANKTGNLVYTTKTLSVALTAG